MKILFLTHRLPYAANRGDRIRALHILKALVAHHEVHLVSLVHDAEEQRHAADLEGLATSVSTARVNKFAGYTRALAAVASDRAFTHAILDAKALRRACERLVREHRPDVVLAFCSGMARFALEPPLDTIPWVLDMVDVDSAKWGALALCSSPPVSWIYAAEARRLSRFEVRASMSARTVLVVNERERSILLRLAPMANVQVMPIGVVADELRPPGPPTDQLRVIFCGVMNYRPNEEGALWFARLVWPRVRSERPHAQLAIVGSQPTAAIRSLAERDPTITVTGSVPDVRPYLWQSAVAVAPLLTARGVQNKVLEAVAAGLPCVVTPAVTEGLPSEVKSACVTAGDVETFAKAVVCFLDRSPEERRAVAASADMGPLKWDAHLAPLPSILEAAARQPRTV